MLEARCGLGALEVRLQFSEGDMADDECEGSSTELDADYGVDDAVDGNRDIPIDCLTTYSCIVAPSSRWCLLHSQV